MNFLRESRGKEKLMVSWERRTVTDPWRSASLFANGVPGSGQLAVSSCENHMGSRGPH